MKTGFVLDYLTNDQIDIEVDDRGVGIIHAVTIREGPMRYTRDGEVRWEHVSGSEIAKGAKTFTAAPVTDGHPPGLKFVTPQKIRDLARGISDTNAEIIEDEEGRVVLKQTLLIHDPELVGEIKSGKKQISTGRKVDFDPTPGEFDGIAYDVVQRNLRANHIAIVEEGRCGEACSVLDSLDQEQRQLPTEVEECVQSVKEENPGIEKETAIAICQEQVGDAIAFRDRVINIMDTMDEANGEIIERISNIVHRDAETMQSIIAGNTEPNRGDIKAISQVLGIKKNRVLRWAKDEWSKNAFDSEDSESYAKNEAGQTSESTDSDHSEKKTDMEIDIAGEKITLDEVCDECEELQEGLEKIQDTANAKFTEALYSIPEGSEEKVQDALSEQLLVEFLADVLEVEAGQVVEMINELNPEFGESGEGEGEGSETEMDDQDQPEDDAGDGQSSDQPDEDETQEADQSQDAQDVVDTICEITDLVSEIKSVDPSYRYDRQGPEQVKLDVLEKVGGITLDELPKTKQDKIMDKPGYLDALVDQVIEDHKTEDEGGGQEDAGHKPDRSVDSGSTVGKDGKVTDEQLQEYRKIRTDRSALRERFGYNNRS